MTSQAPLPRKKFLVELIKPSHYDDQGYIIQWWRGFIPSNSLSCLYGLALDVSDRRALGDDVDIDIEIRDETNSYIPVKRIIRRFRRNQNRGLVCLVGVQTNQFARAVDIARELRVAGIQVAIGGFHVSGCLAMLPELPAELEEALALGITLFAGEAEGRLDEIFRAAYEGRLRPLYNFMNDMPDLGDRPLPFLPQRYVERYAGKLGSFDAGRGCPYSCSFCSIINVQGRKSRYRTADDIEQVIRASYAQGVRSYFITDDDFARNKNWEAILDRIIELRNKSGFKINILMQVDALSHRIPNFVTKAARAGCRKVFIGLENINPESLKGASKGQNHITEYRKMLQAWRSERVLTQAGYILGFPADTPESIERDISIIQRELPIDILEFTMLTPGPGSQRPSGSLSKGSPDVGRHQPVRFGARRNGARADDVRRVGGHLQKSVAFVLLAQTRRDPAAASRSDRAQYRPCRIDDLCFLRESRFRGSASTAVRGISSKAAQATPTRIWPGKSLRLLSSSGEGNPGHLRAWSVVSLEARDAALENPARSRGQGLHRYRALTVSSRR